jgi:hypothetical protein
MQQSLKLQTFVTQADSHLNLTPTQKDLLQQKLKNAKPSSSVVVGRPQTISTQQFQGYAANATNGQDKLHAINLLVNLWKICSQESTWNDSSHSCYIQFRGNSITAAEPSIIAKPPTVGGGSASSTIPALTPYPSPPANADDTQNEVTNAQGLIHQLQSPSPAPSPCGTGFPNNFCTSLSNPTPAPSILIFQPVSYTFPAKFGNISLAQFAINASVSPPLLSRVSGSSTPSNLGNATVNLTVAPLSGLTDLLPGIFGAQRASAAAPTPTPLNVGSLSVSINTPPPAASASPSPSPTPYVTFKASLGTSTLYQQSMGIASQLLPQQLQFQQTSANLCAVADNQPLLVAYPLAPGVNLVFTFTCPLVAGYEITDLWVPNEFSALGAPVFSLGITGSAAVTGVGNFLAAGGTATLNVATVQMRGVAFADTITDTFAPTGQQDVLLGGAYVFGYYTVAGGDIYAKVSAWNHTLYVRVLHVDPAIAHNFNAGNVTAYYFSS